MSFEGDLRLDVTGDGMLERDVDRSWFGWAGQFGGYVLALQVEAVRRTAGAPDRPLRALHLQFLRPFGAGRFRAAVTVERAGRSATFCSTRLFVDDTLCGVGTALLAGDRDSEDFVDATMPAVASWEACGGAGAEGARPVPLPFTDRIEMRYLSTDGYMAGTEAQSGGWIRLVEPGGGDERFLVVAADAFMPATYRRITTPSMGGTMDFTAHFRNPVPAPVVAGREPILVHLRTAASLHGYTEEDAELWTTGGVLLAQSRQLRYIQRADRPLPETGR
jgi:acyl-CoA thioesterase